MRIFLECSLRYKAAAGAGDTRRPVLISAIPNGIVFGLRFCQAVLVLSRNGLEELVHACATRGGILLDERSVSRNRTEPLSLR